MSYDTNGRFFTANESTLFKPGWKKSNSISENSISLMMNYLFNEYDEKQLKEFAKLVKNEYRTLHCVVIYPLSDKFKEFCKEQNLELPEKQITITEAGNVMVKENYHRKSQVMLTSINIS